MAECWCDYDPPEFYHKETRKARTAKTCFECCGPIVPGERYEHVRGKWDGCLDTFRTCDRCLELRDYVEGNVPCVCWMHGEMFNCAREAIDDAIDRAPQETAGLLFGFLRRRVQIQRHNKRSKGEYNGKKTPAET